MVDFFKSKHICGSGDKFSFRSDIIYHLFDALRKIRRIDMKNSKLYGTISNLLFIGIIVFMTRNVIFGFDISSLPKYHQTFIVTLFLIYCLIWWHMDNTAEIEKVKERLNKYEYNYQPKQQ